MKKLLALTLSLIMLLSLAACAPKNDPGTGEENKLTINITAIAGTTGMGFAKLMDDDKNGNAAFDYNFEIVGAADLASSAIIGGKADIAAVPTNLAAVLHKKTEGQVQIIAANTLGVLYLLENGETVSDIKSLEGKTIYCCQQGANPEYITNYLLTQNGLEVGKDVFLDFKYNSPDELTAAIAGGMIDLAVLPEPKVTAARNQNENLRVALDFTKEWEAVSGGRTLVQGCLIARKGFIDEHPEELARFLEEYSASINFVNSNPDQASEMIAGFGIIPKAPLAKKAIPTCNLAFISGEEMVDGMMSFFEVLFAANPASVGGEMPDSSKLFYTGK